MSKILIAGHSGFIGRYPAENSSRLDRNDTQAVWHAEPKNGIDPLPPRFGRRR